MILLNQKAISFYQLIEGNGSIQCLHYDFQFLVFSIRTTTAVTNY